MPISLCDFMSLDATPARPATSVPDPLLIGIVGRKQAGKDTAADYLVMNLGFERYSFANPIKTMLEALFVECGVDYAHLFEPKLKELPLARLGGVSARQLMQTLGTEWGRDILHPDFWLHVADLVLGLPDAPVHDRIVVSDVRYENEAAWVRRHGGRLIRVIRPFGLNSHGDSHSSEAFSNDIVVDATVTNDGSIADLGEHLEVLLDGWGANL